MSGTHYYRLREKIAELTPEEKYEKLRSLEPGFLPTAGVLGAAGGVMGGLVGLGAHAPEIYRGARNMNLSGLVNAAKGVGGYAGYGALGLGLLGLGHLGFSKLTRANNRHNKAEIDRQYDNYQMMERDVKKMHGPDARIVSHHGIWGD